MLCLYPYHVVTFFRAHLLFLALFVMAIYCALMAWSIETGVDEETRARQVGRMLCRTGFVRVRQSNGKLKYHGKQYLSLESQG